MIRNRSVEFKAQRVLRKSSGRKDISGTKGSITKNVSICLFEKSQDYPQHVVARLRPRLKLLKRAEAENFNPVPLYLVFLPGIVLILQLTLAPHATNFSRDRAIA
jgi:hypothetical protein